MLSESQETRVVFIFLVSHHLDVQEKCSGHLLERERWVVSNEIQRRWVAPTLAIIYQTFLEIRSPKYRQYVRQKKEQQLVTQPESFLI